MFAILIASSFFDNFVTSAQGAVENELKKTQKTGQSKKYNNGGSDVLVVKLIIDDDVWVIDQV